MWYTTQDAQRDAEKQAEYKRKAGIPEQCSSFCHPSEPCSITGNGKCYMTGEDKSPNAKYTAKARYSTRTVIRIAIRTSHLSSVFTAILERYTP